ncbi:hypothetical protein G4Y79_18250 [Phototrophicus methaneseepsis]|uniref:Uncharacterized protein n=1 Tax=Phototrophicus methaneseepsis TaxID=2710758 RepID=A0A7S8IDK0_9CHLR|nr:hypothetical protein [Phototrophicus methaneseepsis]QPC81616.1 hypothetical protein G4Y79_18250 [Phototrophicus methaneseepsis]
MADDHAMRLLDVWAEAAPYFMGYSEEAPEIVLGNMTASTMDACILHLLHGSRELTTQFVMKNTNIRVVTPSPLMTARALSGGRIGGGLWLDLPLLPTLGLFVDGPHAMNISFVRGEWDAMSLLALFVLLRDLYHIAPQCSIWLAGSSYEPYERDGFIAFVQEYLHETA